MSVAATVCCTIVFVVMFAKAVGSLLPMIAEKIGVDPAVMASPLISTITDAVSLLIYFSIGKNVPAFLTCILQRLRRNRGRFAMEKHLHNAWKIIIIKCHILRMTTLTKQRGAL